MNSQLFEPTHESPHRVFRAESVEVIRAQLPIGFSSLKHMVHRHQHRMCHGKNRSFRAAPSRETPILRRDVLIRTVVVES